VRFEAGSNRANSGDSPRVRGESNAKKIDKEIERQEALVGEQAPAGCPAELRQRGKPRFWSWFKPGKHFAGRNPGGNAGHPLAGHGVPTEPERDGERSLQRYPDGRQIQPCSIPT
jgi:hypothetical protein